MTHGKWAQGQQISGLYIEENHGKSLINGGFNGMIIELKEVCRDLLGVQISKQMQTSYWGKEELKDDQIEYAINDVIYLHSIRADLIKLLNIEKHDPYLNEINPGGRLVIHFFLI